MHYVTSPSNAKLRGTGDKEKGIKDKEATFEEFVIDLLGGDARWFSDAAWRSAWDAVVDGFEGTPPGAVAALEDEHWEKLKTVATTSSFSGPMKASVRSFVRAITDAPKERLADKRTEAEAKEGSGA